MNWLGAPYVPLENSPLANALKRQRALDAAVRLNSSGIGFTDWLPEWWFDLVRKDFHRIMTGESA